MLSTKCKNIYKKLVNYILNGLFFALLYFAIGRTSFVAFAGA